MRGINNALDDVESLAYGNWLEIISGLAPEFAEAANKNGSHVDCPLHGGKNDFRFDKVRGPEKGLSFCSCGTRNGFQLLQESLGLTFFEAKKAVAQFLGLGNFDRANRQEQVDQAKKRMAAKQKEQAHKDEAKDRVYSELLTQTWERCVPIMDASANLGRSYLKSRKLDPEKVSGFLRFHPSMPLMENGRKVGEYPALVAKVIACNGVAVTLHRTYLDPLKATKLPGDNSKKLMPVPPVKGQNVGRMIPLTTFDKEKGVLGIAEGIETALASSLLFNVPCWSTISTGPMTSFTPPNWVRNLVVFADTDPLKNIRGEAVSPGLKAALQLRENLANAGWQGKVHIRHPINRLENQGYDWADAWFDFGEAAIELRQAL